MAGPHKFTQLPSHTFNQFRNQDFGRIEMNNGQEINGILNQGYPMELSEAPHLDAAPYFHNYE